MHKNKYHGTIYHHKCRFWVKNITGKSLAIHVKINTGTKKPVLLNEKNKNKCSCSFYLFQNKITFAMQLCYMLSNIYSKKRSKCKNEIFRHICTGCVFTYFFWFSLQKNYMFFYWFKTALKVTFQESFPYSWYTDLIMTTITVTAVVWY